MYTATGGLRDYANPVVKVKNTCWFGTNSIQREYKNKNPSDFPYLVKKSFLPTQKLEMIRGMH